MAVKPSSILVFDGHRFFLPFPLDLLGDMSPYICGGLWVFCCCSYREPDEVKQVKKTRDPIKTLGERMIDGQVATEDELKVCVHMQLLQYLFTRLNLSGPNTSMK